MGGRKKKSDKRKEGLGERRLGRRKEKRGWRTEEEIRNKSKKVGEKRWSPFGYIYYIQHQKVCLVWKYVYWLSFVSLENCRSAKVVKLSIGWCEFRMFVS